MGTTHQETAAGHPNLSNGAIGGTNKKIYLCKCCGEPARHTIKTYQDGRYRGLGTWHCSRTGKKAKVAVKVLDKG